jgi:hypothetical protein
MIPGIFGFSLIFEILLLYYALHLWLTNVDKRWVYFLVGVIALIYLGDLDGARWAELLSGRFDLFWREIFENFGFR